MGEYISDGDIDNLARKLRTIFAKRKRQEIPNFRMGQRTSDLGKWKKIAYICHELRADPEDFIEAGFRYNKALGGPFVQTFMGKGIKSWFNDFINHGESSDDNKWMSEIDWLVEMDYKNLVRCFMKNKDKLDSGELTLHQMVMDPFNRIPAYMALCVFPENPEIVRDLFDKARKSVKGSGPKKEAIQKLVESQKGSKNPLKVNPALLFM